MTVNSPGSLHWAVRTTSPETVSVSPLWYGVPSASSQQTNSPVSDVGSSMSIVTVVPSRCSEEPRLVSPSTKETVNVARSW